MTDDRDQSVPSTPQPTPSAGALSGDSAASADAVPVGAASAPAARSGAASVAARVPGQGRSGRPAGVLAQILGHDDEDDDRPLPDLPPLPADPRWRIEHLPMISAIGIALALCATSAGFLFGGPAIGLGLGAGVVLVAIGYSVSTLAIGWADTLRPALVLPVGLAVYVIKYILIALILIAAGASGWTGAKPMAFGIAIGAVVMTAAQAFWIARRANRRAAENA